MLKKGFCYPTRHPFKTPINTCTQHLYTLLKYPCFQPKSQKHIKRRINILIEFWDIIELFYILYEKNLSFCLLIFVFQSINHNKQVDSLV